jgi:hypothetical protein
MEPYPISVRTLNRIKFLNRNKIRDQRIDACLYTQVFTTILTNIRKGGLGSNFGI